MRRGHETETQRLRRLLRTIDPDSPEAQSLRDKSPEELFVLFDEDESGKISYKEFRRMLPFLGIEISDAKALKYFNLCDSDADDNIVIEEFRVALYICNPTTGNNAGFTPYKYLTPLDAFETFDEQHIGVLDEDEFFFALDYLGIKLTEEKMENLFASYDIDKSGSIDYTEFREAFLSTCDIKKELQDRGEVVPTLVRKKVLIDLLRPLLIEDEERERRALLGAFQFRDWIFSMRETRARIDRAKYRAAYEFSNAMDLGGQVYVFGAGINDHLGEPPRDEMRTKSFLYEQTSRINELWKDKVFPEQLIERLQIYNSSQESNEKKTFAFLNSKGSGAEENTKESQDTKEITSKQGLNAYENALNSPFRGLNVALNTSFLWGRRISSVAVSDSVIFALSDMGDVFCWGGHDLWWHELQPESSGVPLRGRITPRSRLLMGVAAKECMDCKEEEEEYGSVTAATTESSLVEDRNAEMIMVVCKYFDVWELPPNPTFKQQFFEKELLPKIKYEVLYLNLSYHCSCCNNWSTFRVYSSHLMCEGSRRSKALKCIYWRSCTKIFFLSESF